ncbi:hypothetical protein [Massilia genomosp. 1]|uniref:Beta-ketoacyl synthase N-terminal domain-containing protein n=1 Tax=Massilia genomosp. 1 TaxID=2609280 RepID=A0ABX0N4F9_9BURK|nr:hypothetical protein [Massilia genomosp. 1]NHZ66727.1 hypothetical protein [Massilia genomosp. 1]
MSSEKKMDMSGAKNSLLIAATGLCCAVGYNLDAALCAINANIDHFRESNFHDNLSQPINVAMLPDDIYGEYRLYRWVEYAIRDCAQKMKDPSALFDAKRTIIIALSAELARPHAVWADHKAQLLKVMNSVMEDIIPIPISRPTGSQTIEVINQGRTGLSNALLKSAGYLINQDAEQVLLIGMDSYLQAADINNYLKDDRIFTRGNSNGFIPGEAAAAVLLRSASHTVAGVHITGVGSAEESGRHDGSVPSRGEGLTKAVRTAFRQAKIVPAEVNFRISDQNGEDFFANDATNAITRIMFGEHKLAHLTLSDKLGEIGAATGPAMLAWLSAEMADRALSPGNIGLLHLANDDGTRCAVTLRYQGEL